MRACLLCGKPANSLEHYIPVWLSVATGRGADPIVIGTALEGKIVDKQNRGCALAAKHRNLCKSCNGNLGTHLEGIIQKMLTPLVQTTPITQWAGHLNALLPRERHLLVWWTVLRAIQLNEQFAKPRISVETKNLLLPHLRAVRDGKIPPPPKDYFVEIAQASEPFWGFQLTKQLFERTDGSVERPGSFLWAMQANKFLIVAASAPEAHLMKDRGWGYGITPFDPQKCPQYICMREMVEQSHVSTRLPGVFKVKIGNQYRLDA
jgi:hypothetical protein